MPRLTGEPAPAWEGKGALDTQDVVETDRRCAMRKENKQERSRHAQAGSELARLGLWRSLSRRNLDATRNPSDPALYWAWGGSTPDPGEIKRSIKRS